MYELLLSPSSLGKKEDHSISKPEEFDTIVNMYKIVLLIQG